MGTGERGPAHQEGYRRDIVERWTNRLVDDRRATNPKELLRELKESIPFLLEGDDAAQKETLVLGINQSNFTSEAIAVITELINQSGLSHTEMEQKIREHQISKEGNYDINDLLYCSAHGDYLSLHVHANSTQSPFHYYAKMKEGFKILAERIRGLPDHGGLKRIEGTSWIIAEHPELLERLGFAVARDENGEVMVSGQNGHASIDIDAFLEKWG
jgi:hypothetical protein